MESSSPAASATAVATFTARACSAMAGLRSLCQSPPGLLHAVNNEVADLEPVLSPLAALTKEQLCLSESSQSGIAQLSEKAKTSFVELISIVDQNTIFHTDDKLPLVAANEWLEDRRELRDIQKDIRAVKRFLNIMLGAANSYANDTPILPSHSL